MTLEPSAGQRRCQDVIPQELIRTCAAEHWTYRCHVRTPTRDALVPDRTALVVFDLLECYRHRIEEAGTVEPVRRLLAACRRRGVCICYSRADHRADGSDANRTLTDTDEAFRPWVGPQQFRPPHPREAYRVLAELAPEPDDYDVPKHRWSAFHQTHLDLSLRSRGVDTVLLVGGSTHVGIASTAFAARDLDYQVVVVSDGLTGHQPQRDFFARHVFPRMCRVRTADEVVAMLDRGLAGGTPQVGTWT